MSTVSHARHLTWRLMSRPPETYASESAGYKDASVIVEALFGQDPAAGHCTGCLKAVEELPAPLRSKVEPMIAAEQARRDRGTAA